MEMDPTFCDPNHILESSNVNCKNQEQDMDMEHYEFPKDEIEEEIDSPEETFEDEFQLQEQDLDQQVELEILNHRERRRNFTKQMFRFVNVAIVGLAMFAAVLRPMEEKIARRAEPRSLGIQDMLLGVTSQHQQRFLEDNYYDAAYNEKDDDDDAAVDGEDNGDDAVVVEYYDDMTDDANDTAAYYDDNTAIVDDFYIYIDDEIEEMKVFPMEITDYAGFTAAGITIMLSIGGGIGPGAILVAIYIIVMDFPPKVAIPLSCVTGLGMNTFGTLLNCKRRHPLSDRPIIDWDLILVMQPVVLLGALIGTYVNKVLEAKTLIVMLVLLLSVVAHMTLKKAKRMHHVEELAIKRYLWQKQKRMSALAQTNSPVYPGSFDSNGLAKADPPFVPKVHSMYSNSPSNSGRSHRSRSPSKNSHSSRRAALLDDNTSQSSFSQSFNLFIKIPKEDAQSVKSSLMEEEADQLPQNKVTYIVLMFLFVIAANIMKGGIAFESPLGVRCGSVLFWFFEFMTASWLITCTYLAGKYLLRRHAIKEAVGYDYVRGDIKWDVKTVLIYPIACCLAGMVSGMFGIAVSVMIGPMLVGIGVNPAVAAATCGTMNFFTALISTSSYVVLGSIIPDREYAYVFYTIGFISASLGYFILGKTRSGSRLDTNKRLERHSYMAYSMGLVVLLSALCMAVEAILDVVNHSFDEDELDGVCTEERIY